MGFDILKVMSLSSREAYRNRARFIPSAHLLGNMGKVPMVWMGTVEHDTGWKKKKIYKKQKPNWNTNF